jgi:exopolysaccharide biosynthesis polyprenyl glycosylphosphotransferase
LEREHAGHHRISIYGLEHSQADLRRLITDALQDDYDRIIFCVPPSEVGNLRRLIDEIGFLPARLEICLAQTELQTLRKDFLGAPPHVLIDIGQRSRSEWAPMFKRAMDLGLGFVLLLATAPIIVLAAIAIKLDSRGPVFFRQRRHGWNHSIIWVWKLRSMTVLEDGNSVVQVGQNDKRVTRVGRFIRRTSIDELPQLFNVLSGEMSLVGPRPHALAHNVQYSDQIERYASRHIVKPGITGWAQIKDLRGNSEDISKMVARAEADLWYVQNWSIALDLWILLVTPFKLLSHKNAV